MLYSRVSSIVSKQWSRRPAYPTREEMRQKNVRGLRCKDEPIWLEKRQQSSQYLITRKKEREGGRSRTGSSSQTCCVPADKDGMAKCPECHRRRHHCYASSTPKRRISVCIWKLEDRIKKDKRKRGKKRGKKKKLKKRNNTKIRFKRKGQKDDTAKGGLFRKTRHVPVGTCFHQVASQVSYQK